ncbi:MAG TPA: metallopeptidase TldD-related protein [Candidatus Limnocylindria bacterium]|nr:metallopeptidase TldD-related protein [Candidatus Limnocylindria bacterium]
MLFGERALRAICDKALRAADGDEAEAVVVARTAALTRFANGAIHQNVVSREAELRVRVVRGTRVAIVTTDRLDGEGIHRAATDASSLTKITPENPTFGGLPGDRDLRPAPSAFVERTAEATPLDRARAAKQLCDAARAASLSAAGYVSTNVQELAVANSRGVWAYAPATMSDAELAAIGDAGTAFAQRLSLDFGTLDIAGCAREAVAKAKAAQRPRDLAPGTHEVILEPYAVRDMISFLGSQLTGQAVEEGRSFVVGKLGQKVTGDVTLVDDPFDPRGVPRSFDLEGQPSERITLVERGVAKAVVYDSQTAHRTGQKNTGHALPPNPFQPAAPMHLRLEPGTKTREQLIADTKNGVLVTRFWYTRWVHQLRTIVTGMTRDGTFAIVDGEIAYPVKNFRFTQSYHEALGGTLGVGSELALLVPGEQFGLQVSSYRVPALRLAAFAFTGATQY